ncbi:hypothetical protein PIB30_023385 [Stylosanthes scabra]|uniref:Uncharacterized protein n=1 Tax=Stylosanthes scabra TaxID=79078 RepID=A0ABU6V8G5_9FABA|nr:hypothetical protein [Stylosanthes scabra]
MRNFELKSGLINLLPKFNGLPDKDPIKHLKDFDVIYQTIRRTSGHEDAALIDASSGVSLKKKTLEEAWELIETIVDANQHFKTRLSTSAKGVFEVAPSESTVLTKSFVDIAAMLKEIKEGQQAAPKLLKQ